MTSRIPLGILSTALAFAIAAPLHAAPTASAAAPVDSMTYHIERHNQQVTVKNASGKMLATFFATTPTIQGVLAKAAPSAGVVPINKNSSHQPMFTLEDQNGKRLWSTLVPVLSPTNFRLIYNADMSGTELVLDHQTENTSDHSQPLASRLFFMLDADGHPLSAGDNLGNKFAISPTGASLTDSDGKVLFKAQGTPNDGAIFSGPDGMTGSVKTTDTGASVNLNGIKFEIKKVTKDGKEYSSFPWNGHNVLVEQPCTLGFTSDGDLTVNIPEAAKTTATK